MKTLLLDDFNPSLLQAFVQRRYLVCTFKFDALPKRRIFSHGPIFVDREPPHMCLVDMNPHRNDALPHPHLPFCPGFVVRMVPLSWMGTPFLQTKANQLERERQTWVGFDRLDRMLPLVL